MSDQAGDERTRLLSDLIANDAPLPVARAAAIMWTVSRQLLQSGHDDSASGALSADRVLMHEDGSVTLVDVSDNAPPAPGWAAAPAATAAPEVDDGEANSSRPSPAGASIGRLLFALLVGRAPLDRADAHEPAITDALSPDDSALMARSCSDAPGQWPSVDDWTSVLARLAGGAAPELSPGEVRRARTRKILLTLGVVLLAAITVTVLALAPTWWSAVNEQPSRNTTATSTTVTTSAGG